ncbi:MAG TPA: hypothetical protein VGB24_23705 [Longimicrobium sp.]|jgi:hypothetical protein|uniref:hypothetical protein n=1 Tax=Longimicrobium sp. TaxID=2029185 RepID=UPI002EDA82A5
MKRIALLAAAFLLASCNGEPTLSDAQLTFTSDAPPATSSDPETPQVSGFGGAIRVNGRFQSPCVGGTLHGDLLEGGRSLTLVVDWEQPSGCYTAIGKHGYVALISGLEPRDYRLRVLHRAQGGSPERVVFDGTVEVLHPNLR